MLPVSAIAGACLVGLAWVHYLWLVPREQVPQSPRGHGAVMVLGMGLGIAGIATPSWAAALGLFAFTGGLAGLFFWLLTLATLPDQTPTVAVGDPLPAFEVRTSSDNLWTSDSLQGHRVLLKFFRGHW